MMSVADVLAGAAALAMLTAGPFTDTGRGSGPATVTGGRVADESLLVRANGRFSPPTALVPSAAVTYDLTLVPAGARIEIVQKSDRSGTSVRTRLTGLKPGFAYGMHVHTLPCGADPKAAGPHYQHVPAPTADPVNEVWLDFVADPRGRATAETTHTWGFRRGAANSVVLHGEQGGAGDRIACFTVPFGGYGPQGTSGAR
ncbi:superoxide dismutase family protein [Streptomyces sp. NPDC003042]